ncbi:TetR family transcriptional regulator [Caulobacter rhizosphaerae]|nr:TetR family transcriptional regulator [Caulobacter rhizosphaerae]
MCLFEYGYGSTTTSKVAEKAGISRGAMLHQFPSKADLMTFVVEETFARDVELYRRLLTGAEAPRERLVAYPAAVWEVLSQPSGIAVLEVLQGSRSDPQLAGKLTPILERIDAAASAQLLREFPRGPSRALRQLIVGAMHGLAMMNVMGVNDEAVRDAVPLLQTLLRAGLQTGVFDSEPDEAGLV